MIEITKELAEALVHQGPCRAARELHVETVQLASKGVCPFCDLVRLVEIERGCGECVEFEKQAEDETQPPPKGEIEIASEYRGLFRRRRK